MEGYPLSPQQSRLWQLGAGDSTTPYRTQCVVGITGEWAPQTLLGAIHHLVSRHEILRTTFRRPTELEPALQYIAEEMALVVTEIDLAALPPVDLRAACDSLVEKEWRQPMAADRGPLIRAAHVQLGPTEGIIILTVSALCLDGPGMRRLLVELARHCGAGTARPRAGAEGNGEPMQFADVADWLNELLTSDETATAREYWQRQKLEPRLAVSLPWERMPSGDADFEPRALSTSLATSTLRPVQALAATTGGSSADLLLAVWRVLLWRLTNESEVPVGAAFEGRRFDELKDALGPLSRYLPLAGALHRGMTLHEVVGATRRGLAELHPWQEYFDWDRVPAPRSGEVAFLPFLFDYAEAPPPLRTGGLRLTLIVERGWSDRCRAALRCRRSGDRLELELGYDSGALWTPDAERLLAQLCRLLESASRRPNAPIGDLEILGATERRQLLVDFNRTRRQFPDRDLLLHNLFERQAARAPEATAVTRQAESLSYAELDRRANQLAHHLERRGVGPDVRVAVVAESALQTFIAFLGVLKAGGGYVPIDASYPRQRIARMLEDSRPALVLARGAWARRLPPGTPDLLRLDDDWRLVAGEDTRRPPCAAQPDNFAYVLFTSGSSGRPKGVMIPHRAVVNHHLHMSDEMPMTAADRLVQRTPFSFDGSVYDLYATLRAGGCLILAPAAAQQDCAELVKLAAEQRATILHMVPTLLEMVLDQPGFEGCRAVRRILCGGEVLPAVLARRLFARGFAGELYNLYGPTETTIHATCWRCRPSEEANVPIGRPLANVRLHVLDRESKLSPIHLPGDLHVSGRGLARGYVGQPRETAERFVPDPFSRRPGRRAYRTGDEVRMRLDGAAEFGGRLDLQCNLHGYRVEVGEIESMLKAHPGVGAAAANVLSGASGDQRLVAWWVAGDSGNLPDTEELRRYLKQHLPAFMIPARFVRLPELPRTASGKVDRRALPEPPSEAIEREEAFVPPGTPDEELLAAVWSRVLEVDEVGVHDNFFVLGGDSILAVRAVALTREKGIALSLIDLFENQSIHELARRLVENRDEIRELTGGEPFELVSEADRCRLPAEVEDAYPMTSLQLGMLYHMQMSRDAPLYHDVLSFLIETEIREELLRPAVDRVVARHPALRTGLDIDRFSEPLQLVFREAHLSMELEDLSALDPRAQEQVTDALIARERLRLFELDRPPLLRFFLHRLSDRRLRLTLTVNHAILDGWSLTSILREVLTLHNALLAGDGRPEEPPLGVSFRDFVRLERMASESEEHRGYWREKLRNAEPTTLPRRRSNLPAAESREADLAVELPYELCVGIKRLARACAVPLKSVCLAAHLKVLSLISGRVDVITGLPTHGRLDHADGERVRGLFLNTLPFRVQLGEETWRQLVAKTFEDERELIAYRRYPLSAILQSWRQPLFEVLFSFVHFHHVQSLLESSDLRFFDDYKGWEAKESTLMCGFNQHPPSNQLKLRLYYDATEIAPQQVQGYASLFRKVFEALVQTPDELHSGLELADLVSRRELAHLQRSTEVTDLDKAFSF